MHTIVSSDAEVQLCG